MGRKFIIKTDHVSLKYLLEQRITTPSQQKWLSKLLGYDYEIWYKSGKENRAADALSRVHSSNLETLAISSVNPSLLVEIQQSWQDDSKLQQLMKSLIS